VIPRPASWRSRPATVLVVLFMAACLPEAPSGGQTPTAAPAAGTAAPSEDLTPVAGPTAAEGQTPQPGDRPVSVLACGDILLSRTPGKRAEQYGYRYLFEGMRELVSSADVAFANLETPASWLGQPYPGKPENVTFRADPATLFGLSWAGFDVLSLANNHINDYGPRALTETLDYLDLLGLGRVGAGRDLAEARRPVIVERDGVRLAFLAYAEPAWSVVEARGAMEARVLTRVETRLHGAPPPPASPRDPDDARSSMVGVAPAVIADMVADVRRALATLDPDYLFVSVHWGDEHQNLPRAFQKAFGRAAVDAGATAVFGHHPHVLQSVERYGDGLIAYSLGNFVFDMKADATYLTAALRLNLAGGALRSAEIIPVRIVRGSYAPEPAGPADAMTILNGIRRWSRALGTELSIESGRGFIRFP